jgi:hypothetical protein
LRKQVQKQGHISRASASAIFGLDLNNRRRRSQQLIVEIARGISHPRHVFHTGVILRFCFSEDCEEGPSSWKKRSNPKAMLEARRMTTGTARENLSIPGFGELLKRSAGSLQASMPNTHQLLTTMLRSGDDPSGA